MIRALACTLVLLSLAPATPAATVQGGYTVKKHPSRGVDFRKPRRWDKLPMQPTEKWVRFQLIEPVPEKERDRRKLQPKIEIIDIPYVADPAPLTGEYGEEEPEDEGAGEEEGVSRSQDEGDESDEQGEEEDPPPPPLNSWERYLDRKLKG